MHDLSSWALSDQLPAVLWSVDLELRFTWLNRAAIEAFDLANDEVLGASLYENFGSRDETLPQLKAHKQALLGQYTSYEAFWCGRWFEARVAPLREAGGRIIGALGLAIDVSERKRAEQARDALQLKLRDRHKLEAIAQLAGGLAHEINNPLQSIINFAQLIRSRSANDPVREYAEEIVEEVQRLAAIVRNLRCLTRDHDELPVEVKVASLVGDTLSLLRGSLQKEQIAIVVDLPDELPPAWCRAQGIQQVLLNLLMGARDALNTCYPTTHPNKQLSVRACTRGIGDRQQLRLTVEDRGSGIRARDLAHVFEPFTMLEGREQGSGLRLAVSRAIVRESGGELSVESAPDRHTSFHIDLPIASSS